MEITLGSRVKNAWNAFFSRDPTYDYINAGSTSYRRPDRVRFSGGNEKSIITSIYNRIAMDAAAIDIQHVRLDEDGRYIETIDSALNNCLTVEANIDQTGQAFMQDVYMSLFDEGAIAIVPTDTSLDPHSTSAYDILSMRTGKITQWRPDAVKVWLYNENTGKREDIWLPKSLVAVIENPFYSIMNEHNSTVQRLNRKLNLLDAIDEQSGSGKMDLIIQLPYVVKSPARREQAEQRRKDIETQLAGSKYGIAYTDGTERITQLNRPVENNLLKQIEYLTNMVYSQLGITSSILDGTADQKTMQNYRTRIVERLVSTVVDEMKRKFLTKTARTQHQSIAYFNDPFNLATLDMIAEVADTLTRNEIVTTNEIRSKIGFKPSKDPKADQLINSNIKQPETAVNVPKEEPVNTDEFTQEGELQNG